MTVSSDTYKVTAEGNGVATSFSFSPMVILEADHLEVTLTDDAGVETVLSEGTAADNYTVVVSSYPGTGSITYPSSGTVVLAADNFLTMKRKLPFEQTLDLGNQGGYFPELQEEAFDKALMIDLQQQEEMDRTVKGPVSDGVVDLTLPTVTTRAGKFLAFNASGEPIASEASIDTTALSSFIETVVDDADGDEVMTTLGFHANGISLVKLSYANMRASLDVPGLTTATNEFSSTNAGSAAGPIISLYRNSASPADLDFLGEVQFHGENDAGDKIEYARVSSRIADATDTTEDGRLIFETMVDGTLTTIFNIDGDDMRIFQGGLTVVAGDVTVTAGAFTVTAGNATIGGTLTVGGRAVTQLSDKHTETVFSTGATTQLISNTIPTTARRITLSFNAVSTNGTEKIFIQLGDSGGFETNAYTGAVSNSAGQTAHTVGFQITHGAIAAGSDLAGQLVFTRLNSSGRWAVGGMVYNGNGDLVESVVGSKAVSTSNMDRLQFITAGTNTFDSGSFSLIVE